MYFYEKGMRKNDNTKWKKGILVDNMREITQSGMFH